MSKLRRLVLLRHGDTLGDSKTRYHGRTDVRLSDEGRAQVRAAGELLRRETFDWVVSSPLQRAWESARLLTGGGPVQLEQGFREVDFGLWEGLTAEEIQSADPENYARWQAKEKGFAYPGGESRDAFVERVLEGLARLQQCGAANVLVVAHKGVIRSLCEQLLTTQLADARPDLGEVVWLTRRGDGGAWFEGRRGSDPAALEEQAA